MHKLKISNQSTHSWRMHNNYLASRTGSRLTPQTQMFSYIQSIFVSHIQPQNLIDAFIVCSVKYVD